MAHLPEELMQRIFNELVPRGPSREWPEIAVAYKTLHSIALASRQCLRLAQSVLYHILDFNSIRQRERKSLLRTILTQPHCRNAVRRIDASAEGQCDDEAPDDSLAQLYMDAIKRFGIQDVSARLQVALLKGSPEAELLLLVRACPNLQELNIITTMEPAGSFSEFLKEDLITCREISATGSHAARSLPAPYSHLTEVSARHWDTEMSTGIDEVAALLQLPVLEHFRGFMLGAGNGMSLTGVQSTVQDFILEESDVTADGLDQLLRACPKLRNLSFEEGSALVKDEPIDWEAFGATLRRRGSRLVELEITTAEDFDDIYDFDGVVLGDLSSMVSLERLNVPFIRLLGENDPEHHEDPDHPVDRDGVDESIRQQTRRMRVDYLTQILPNSLKTLRLNDAAGKYEWPHHLQVRHLATDVSFPHLKLIKIQSDENDETDMSAEGTESPWRKSEHRGWHVWKRQARVQADV